MFVKVGADSPTLFQIPAGPNGLEYGSEVTYVAPWTVDWKEQFQVAFRFLHYRGGHIPPYTVPPNMPDEVSPDDYWIVHWAWWDDPDKGIYGIVTTEPLYILNDNGKTIDSLRHGSG